MDAIDSLLEDLRLTHDTIADSQFRGARDRAAEIKAQMDAVEALRLSARQWDAHVKGRASE